MPAGQANKVNVPALVPAAGMAFDPAFSLFYLGAIGAACTRSTPTATARQPGT